MNEKFGEFRVAPHNESKENLEDLDAMIVIPAMDEGDAILDTILHAVEQDMYKISKVKYGILVVVNNRPSSPKSVQLSNFKTYLLLQALEHKVPLTRRGDTQFNDKVRRIQNSSVPIHVIDSFSDGYSSPMSNVGRARRIGTQEALKRISDDGFIVSTDADTQIGNALMTAAKLMFETSEDVVGTRFDMYINSDKTSTAENKAGAASNLHWALLECIDTKKSRIESSIVWMSGGGSAFRAKNYKILAEKNKGYSDIPGEEDTRLGMALSDQGWIVRDMAKKWKDMYVSTRQRFSQRASTGFGRQTLRFDESRTQFKDILIESPESLEQKDLFLIGIEKMYYNILIPMYETHPDMPIDDLYEVFSNHSIGNTFVEEFIDKTKDEAIKFLRSHCAQFGIPESDTDKLCEIFKQWRLNRETSSEHHDFVEYTKKVFENLYPQVTMEQFYTTIRNRLLDKNALHETGEEIHKLEIAIPNISWKLVDFERDILRCIDDCGVDVSNPNIRLKIGIATLTAYKDFYTGISCLFLASSVEKSQHEYAESDDSMDVQLAKVLESLKVPREFQYTTIQFSRLKNETQAIAKIQNNIVWDISESTNKKLIEEIKLLQKHTQAFHDIHIKPQSDMLMEKSKQAQMFAVNIISELEADERK